MRDRGSGEREAGVTLERVHGVATSRDYTAVPNASACARGYLRSALNAWHMSAMSETASLVLSELVANAVKASADQVGQPYYSADRTPVIRVGLFAKGDCLLLEVWDSAPGLPALVCASADEETGRGLMLVDALSHRWGWHPAAAPPGKCVWAELCLLWAVFSRA